MNPQYDSALLGILQHEGNIKSFLEVIFGFLMRRTDFYYERKEGEKLGFPKGQAAALTLNTFDKFYDIFTEYQKKHLKNGDSKSENPPKEKTEETTSEALKAEDNPSETNQDSSKESKPEKVTKPQPKPGNAGPGSSFHKDANGERIYEADPDCYNGARRDKYSWSQKILEIDIQIKVPEHIKKANELSVKIERKHVCIKEKKTGEAIIDLDLLKAIKTDTAQWLFEPAEHVLTLSLDKVDEYWWEAAFEGETKINVQEIDCSRPLHELDEEAQGKIAQMLFDQEQKRRGLPTTEEARIQNMLKEAWNKPDSPFAGQPFDPSTVQIANSGQIPPNMKAGNAP